ncbi:MAG: diguanylate cyclase (GGDEF)-like protein [Bacteroidia bacterium]
MIDVDFFKRFNDKYGYAKGDQALKGLVAVIEQRVRRSDVICRVGGEEFVVLLSETNCAHAIKIANDLCCSVAETRLLPEGGFTINIGVSDVTQAQNMEHWLKITDAALYTAKHNGRTVLRQHKQNETRHRLLPSQYLYGDKQWNEPSDKCA